MNRRNLVALLLLILVLVGILGTFVYVKFQNPFAGKMESVTLGVYPSEYSSLVYIASDQKYFSANGLDVVLKYYPSGAAAVSGMLIGEVDIATASEFVVAINAMENAGLCALGSVSKYLNLYIVARTDRAINSVLDLSGKKIGVALGTALQFYLGRYLELNGVSQSQVTLVNLPFAETPTALENSMVEAVMTFEPYVSQIKDSLGDKVVVWPAQADQFGYFEAISTRDWVSGNPDLVKRFLNALIQAESFNINHQEEAIAIVAKSLNYSVSYTSSVWADYQYSVTLDQSFLLLVQDEARWLVSNNLINSTVVPNFSEYVYVDGLKAVNPDAVNIIG